MMQRLKKTAALAVTLALSLLALATPALAAKAQLPELPKGQCVVDEAGVLSQNTVQLVEQLNGQLEANCQGAQIGVLTVEYTGNLSTEEYAVQAFNAWGIGSAKEDNGVLDPAGDGIAAVQRRRLLSDHWRWIPQYDHG